MRSSILALTALLPVIPTPDAPNSPPGCDRPKVVYAAGDRHPVDGPDVDVRVQIQDSAVKFQIIMNLAYVDEIVDTPREDEFSIRPTEVQAIRETLFGYYQKSNKVQVDGIEVAPVDRGFEVDEGDMDMLPLFPNSMEKALVRVQLSLEYPCKGAPGRVSFAWGEFPVNPLLVVPGSSPKIEIKAHLIAKGLDEIVPLTEQEPEYTWHDTGASLEDRFLAVPKPPAPAEITIPTVAAGVGLLTGLGLVWLLVSAFSSAGRQRLPRRLAIIFGVLLVGSPVAYLTRTTAITISNPFDSTPALPTETEAVAIFQPLHRNIYRAFDYVEESEIYDALARSVEGDLLDDLYTQVYRSLIMHEEGGAVSRVQAVRSKNTQIESIGMLEELGARRGFQVHAQWQVDGVVRHWNHAHYRTNEYEARYTVVEAKDGWRIADHVILGQKRIDEGNDAPTGK